jgi:non-ribosomal peptide synthetase component F
MRGGREALPPVPLTYSAWGAAERAFWQPAELNRRAAFWKKNLAGSERLWPDLRGPETTSGAYQRMISYLPAELADAARELARRNRTTLFSTLLTAFQLALSEWTGNEDIVVGTPVANRGKEATRETMGYFAGIVPLRASVDRDRPFAASQRAVHEMTVAAFANAMPFAELVQALGDTPAPGHNPLFEIRFALQNHPIPDVALAGLSAKLRMRSTGTARFHLACEITEEGERLEVVWLFRPNFFPVQEIENLGRMFEAVLAGAARQVRVERLPSRREHDELDHHRLNHRT